LSVGTVSDASMGASVSTTGITTDGADVKLDRTRVVKQKSIAAGVALGGGNMTLDINGNVTQTRVCTITAAGLRILGTGSVRLDNAVNDVATIAAAQSGTISCVDSNALSVGTVSDASMGASVSTTGITTDGADVK